MLLRNEVTTSTTTFHLLAGCYMAMPVVDWVCDGAARGQDTHVNVETLSKHSLAELNAHPSRLTRLGRT